MLAIKASEETLAAYNDAKLVDGADIKPEKTVMKADAGDDYLDAFIKDIKESGQPRFAVVDWNNKLCFVSWVPDTAKAQLKMKFASCKEGFIQELQGIVLKIQATDDGELSKEIIVDKTKSNV